MTRKNKVSYKFGVIISPLFNIDTPIVTDTIIICRLHHHLHQHNCLHHRLHHYLRQHSDLHHRLHHCLHRYNHLHHRLHQHSRMQHHLHHY